tara:strand:- start:346 stop:831 length:486 start_codon:yes stop_codon:yes gene_type:complete
MIKEQIMSELKSYITTYDIEYIVQLNDFTEVVIRTQYTNPSMIARPEDKDEVARVDYTNTKNTNLRTLYNKIQNEMHLYKDDFIAKVKTKLMNTEIKPKEDFGKAYKINQMTTISSDDEMEMTDEEELTLLAQDDNHQIRDELEKTVDELEEEVKEEIENG